MGPLLLVVLRKHQLLKNLSGVNRRVEVLSIKAKQNALNTLEKTSKMEKITKSFFTNDIINAKNTMKTNLAL